jgi:hypothetical protein
MVHIVKSYSFQGARIEGIWSWYFAAKSEIPADVGRQNILGTYVLVFSIYIVLCAYDC